MATYTWSIPSGKSITGSTYIKDTDNNISDTIDDLVNFVNGLGSHSGQGLTYDLVTKDTTQIITGAKTFTEPIIATGGIEGDITGNVTGDVTGNADTAATAATLAGLTSTIAELNKLDGFTGDANDLNRLDGATATTDELNLLAGQTALFHVSDAYPVGSIYMNASNSANPASLLGFGTWSSFGAGRVLVGLDSSQSEFNSIGETGGAKTSAHTLTTAEIPSHTHTIQGRNYRISIDDTAGTVLEPYTSHGYNSDPSTDATGGGGSHSHSTLQPYITVYMWKRTA